MKNLSSPSAGAFPRRACAALVVLAGLSPAAAAQSPPAPEAGEVPAVVVSGTRSEQSTVSVPASVEVITRAEIEASGAAHVAEVLRGRGAVQVADSFGDGSRAQVGMRGFGETAHANTLVLVDGRRLNNGDIAPPDLNSIALKDVERIEIVQGSAGTLFGDQAVGGVINVITRQPREFGASVEAGAGSYARRVVRARAGDRLAGGLSWRVSGERLATDNYRDHNARDYANVLGRVDFDHARGSLFAEAQLVEEQLELPGGLSAAELAADRRQVSPFFAMDRLDTDTRVARAGIRQQLSGPWSLEAEASWRSASAEGTFFASPFRSERTQRELTPRLLGVWGGRRGELLLTLGADLRGADFDLVSPATGTARNRQHVQAAYAQAVLPLAPRWRLTAGARKAWVQNDLTTTSPFGGPAFPGGVELDDSVLVTELGVAWTPTPAWRLYLRRDGNFRFAKADEQSFTVPGQVGLDTQEGVSWEAGAEWSRGTARARLVLYRLALDGEIAFDPTVAGPSPFLPGANVNLASTLRHGVIVGAGWAPAERLQLAADYSYTRAVFDSGGLDGNEVPFVARHVLRLSADYRFSGRLHGFAELQAISGRYLIGDNANALERLPGYTVLNLHADYRWRGWTVSARIDNVTDRNYVDTASPGSFFPAPGRNLWLTLGYRL